MKQLSILILLHLAPTLCHATTWNEPWQEEVVRTAESFVKITVVSSTQKELVAHKTKLLAGTAVPDEFRVTGYSMLQLGSISGAGADELSMEFEPQSSCYLFLKPAEAKGEFAIATPTSGWALTKNKEVAATYRHSYHQAKVPDDVYELTMSAIFRRLHGDKNNDPAVEKFIQEQLLLPPALLSKADDNPAVAGAFFLQHAALETLRYFAKPEDLPRIEPFLKADDRHVQSSAVRVLARIQSEEAKKRAVTFIEGKNHGFAKVLAVKALEEWNARAYREELIAINLKIEDEETGFGGNIMDPRIATPFPRSVKDALTTLLESWK